MGQNPAGLYELIGLDYNSWILPQQAPQMAPHLTQTPPPAPPTFPAKGYAPQRVNSYGAAPVYLVPNTPSGGLVLRAGINNTINGPTAVAIGPLIGGWIINPPNATSQNVVTAENAYIDFVGQPGNSDATGFGTTSIILPGGNFTIPTLAAGVVVWMNAPTAGHRVTVVVW